MKEMVGGCCVCSDERGWPENPLVYCDGQNCTVAVHQACYGIVTVPTGPWYCRKCESQERSARVRCELCPSRDGALKKTDNQGWAHVVCALYIPEVRFGNVTTMEPIILQLIPPERYSKTCYICQENNKGSRANAGACMQCNKSGCKQQFHVTCAQGLGLLCEEAGNYLDNVKYCGYCQHHYSKLKKGGNVKTIPPYKPVTHDTESSGSSPEKEIETTITASTTSATTIKITTNQNASGQSGTSTPSSSSSSSKQRKSSFLSKIQPPSNSVGPSGNGGGSGNSGSGTGGNNSSNSQSLNSGSNSSNSTGTTSTTSSSTKSSSSSSSSKDKDKHSSSKSTGKMSSSSKDKESSSSSSSSRDKSNKSSKSSSNKLDSSINSSGGDHGSSGGNNSTISSTNTSASSSTNTSASSIAATNNSNSQSNSLQHKEGQRSSNFTTENMSANSESVFNNSGNELLSGNVNTSGSSSKNSSSSASKKRRTDSGKTSSSSSSTPLTTNEQMEVNSTFRDIIKDVSVTLIPLPIDKNDSGELEKGSKKPKTETLNSASSSATHQTSSSASLSHDSNVHNQPLSNTTSSSSTISHLNSANNLSGNSGSSILSSSATSSSVSHHIKNSINKEDSRLRSNSPYHSTNNTGSGGTNSSNSNQTPSLYVSVPLSTANVPGVNLPSTTSNVNDHSQSNRSSPIVNQHHHHHHHHHSNHHQSNTINSSHHTSSSSGIERQSPRILHQHSQSSNLISDHSVGSNSIIDRNNSSGGVIQQNSSPSLAAITTESGTLKISYEKHNSRVSKLVEQESAPARRSRSQSNESGGSNQASGSASNSSSKSRSGKKRSANNSNPSSTTATTSSSSSSTYNSSTTTNTTTLVPASIVSSRNNDSSINRLEHQHSNSKSAKLSKLHHNHHQQQLLPPNELHTITTPQQAPQHSSTDSSHINLNASSIKNNSNSSNNSNSNSSNNINTSFTSNHQNNNNNNNNNNKNSNNNETSSNNNSSTPSVSGKPLNKKSLRAQQYLAQQLQQENIKMPILSQNNNSNNNSSATTPTTTQTTATSNDDNNQINIHNSRTPDSGNFSTSTTSSSTTLNLSGSTTNLNNGGLKFTYEQQIGAACSSLSPTTIDTNLLPSTALKDSPPSSPGSEAGSARKRNRKTMIADSKQDLKIFQNGGNIIGATVNSNSNSNPLASHMLGNQLNPNSSMAQKMSDLVHMEIQDHSIYSQTETGSQLMGVPFPGKNNNNRIPTQSSGTNSLTSMLAGTAPVNPSGNTPQSLEQLLERQWEQGSQFLMEQAQHFDIASLLSCLHQLRTENVRLEEHVNSLIARRDHLLAVNARLAIPLNTNSTQNQTSLNNLHMNGPIDAISGGGVSGNSSALPSNTARMSRNPLFNTQQQQQQQQQVGQSQQQQIGQSQQQQPIENGIDFRHTSSSSNSSAIRHSSVHSSNYNSSSSSNAPTHGSNNASIHHGSNILSHHRRDHQQIMQSNLSLNSQSSLPEQLLIRSGRAAATSSSSSTTNSTGSSVISGTDLLIGSNRRNDSNLDNSARNSSSSAYHQNSGTTGSTAHHQSQLRRVDDNQKPS